MKVKELIAILSKCKNQEAEINVKINTINSDVEDFDIENCNLECMDEDIFSTENVDTIDMIAYPTKVSNDIELSISTQFHNYNEVNIKMNCEKGLLLITTDIEKQVLRECEIENPLYYNKEDIKTLLINKLHNIL